MPPTPTVDTGKLLELRYKYQLSYAEIADRVGLSERNVSGRLTKFATLFGWADGAREFQARESSLLAGLRGQLLAHVASGLEAENAKDKVSPYQAVGMYGILFDKQRILDGKSTANIAVLTKLVESAQESGDNALIKQKIGEDKAKS